MSLSRFPSPTHSIYLSLFSFFIFIVFGISSLAVEVSSPALPGTSAVPAEKLSLYIVPSSDSANPGDMLNISYLIRNRNNFTVLNLSLATKESGPLELNVTRLLPGQTAGADESLRIEDGLLAGPLMRTAEVSASDPSGNDLLANSTLSIKIGAGKNDSA